MLIHNAEVTGSLNINNVPFNSGSFSGSFQGDGSQLTGIATDPFPYTGSAIISGSLEVTGSINVSGGVTGSFTGSFFGDGSNLSGVTSYTNADTLAFINSIEVVSGSIETLSIVSDTFTSETSYTVTHNFNTKEVIVSVYENDTVIFPSSITTPTTNTVTVTFPEPVTGRVVVVKAGHIVSGSIDYSNVLNKPTLVSGSEQITYSGLTGIPSGIISGSAQISEFGIFATTGSNQFNGDQAITGSLTTTGTIVAQTLNVQQVTSSIVYSSGSNIFGNSLANTQQFTGSVGVTGSLTVAGALNGTSAAFSGDIRSNAIYRDYQGEALIQTSGSENQIGSAGASTPRSVKIFAGNSTALTIATTGAATFSNTVRTQGEFYGANGTSTAASIRFWDANTGLYHPGSDALGIITSGAERLRITPSGNVLIGSTSGTTLNDLTNQLSVSSTSYNLFDISRFSNNAFGPNFYLVKSRNGTIGSNTIVESGDNLGNIIWTGANGTGFTDAATIRAEVDGTPGASNDMPGRLIFSTTADGSGSPTERLRISSTGAATFSGNVTIGNAANTSISESLMLQGKAITSGGAGPYGNYGSLILNSDSSYTSGARSYLITNAYSSNRFAIIQSIDANTVPTLGDFGGISSGTEIFYILNTGLAGFQVPLAGTSANFSNYISATKNFISEAITDSTSVGITAAENAKYNYVGHGGYWGIKTATGFNFALDTYNSGTPKNVLTITQVGAATFNNSVTATSFGGAFSISMQGAGNNGISDGPFYRFINTTNSYQLLKQLNASTGEDVWYYNGSTWSKVGNLNAVSGVYTALSDVNKKKDFEDSTIGLNAILGLKPTLYRMEDEDESVEKQLGFIAQEVKEYIPQACVEQENFVGLQDRPIIAALVKAIQELKAENDTLKSRIETLEQS